MTNDQKSRRGRRRRLLGLAFVVAGLIAGGVAAALVADYRDTQATIAADGERYATQVTRTAAAEIEAQLDGLSALADGLARELEAAPLTEAEIVARVEAIAASHPTLFGFGVAFRRHGFDPDRALVAPYSVRGETGRALVDIGALYDYTTPDHAWFAEPMAQGARWVEPYFGAASKTLVASYAVPFRLPAAPGGEAGAGPDGVVVVNFSLDDIKGLLRGLTLGSAGYGFILSHQGAYLAFPLPEYVAHARTVRDVAAERHDSVLAEIGRVAEQGGARIFDHVNISTGQASWIVIEPIHAAGWSMGVTFIKDELRGDPRETRHLFIQIIAVTVAAALCLAFGAGLLAGFGFAGWMATAVVCAAMILAGLGGTIKVAVKHPDLAANPGRVINDGITLGKYVDSLERKAAPPGEIRAVVPTGVYIETLRFLSGTEVSITGQVWQKRPAGYGPRTDGEVTFVDAVSSRLTEVQRRRVGESELVLWAFEATLRQRMTMESFPWDRADLMIRLRPRGMTSAVAFVPDLDSYRVLPPTAKAALNQDLILPGWTIERSLFRVESQPSLTSFGQGASIYETPPQQLVLQVGMRRDPTDPAFSGLVPIFFLLLAAFSVTLMNSVVKEKTDLFGQKPFQVVLLSSSLCFITAAGQTALRTKVATDGLVYLEYFYLAVYVFVMLNAANVLLHARGRGGILINYRDNIIVRTIYWPTVLTVFYLFTVWRFY